MDRQIRNSPACDLTFLENNKAREPCGSRAKLGSGRSPRALSRCTPLGALAFAGRVLPDATLRGMRMYRSHGGTVPTVSGWNLSSEASSPGSDTSCRKRHAGRGADTPAISVSRVGTVATGTAPASGRTLAPRYGSDLLPLRLHLPLQWGDAFFGPPQSRRFAGFARLALSPQSRLPLRARLVRASGPFGGVVPPGNATAFWSCAVATKTLWVTASAHRSKLPVGVTRLAGGFSSPLTAQLLVRVN